MMQFSKLIDTYRLLDTYAEKWDVFSHRHLCDYSIILRDAGNNQAVLTINVISMCTIAEQKIHVALLLFHTFLAYDIKLLRRLPNKCVLNIL